MSWEPYRAAHLDPGTCGARVRIPVAGRVPLTGELRGVSCHGGGPVVVEVDQTPAAPEPRRRTLALAPADVVEVWHP